MHETYPTNTVRALVSTGQVSEATRRALTQRLADVSPQPQFFTDTELTLLRAVCDRLIDQSDHAEKVDVAIGIDQRLAQNKSDGWRYDDMPPDQETYRLGLAGIDTSAGLLSGKSFSQLSATDQDEVLGQIQRSEVPGKHWTALRADRFFEELLAEAVNLYYSHPLAQEEIGYVGMADVPGWQRIGLNEREDREPAPERSNSENSRFNKP